MRWLLVLVAVSKLAAQCGIQPVPAFYDGTNGSSPIPAAGGPFPIAITGNLSTCTWSASVSAKTPWITLNQSSGTGPGTLSWTAAANLTNAQRTGAIHVADWTIPVVQLANTCVPTLSATSASSVVGGSSGSFLVQTVCQWNAFSNQSWITVPAPTNGTGNGTVTYTVAANGCVAGRTGTITAQSGSLSRLSSDSAATFTITEDGSTNNLSLAPASAAPSAAGGLGSITVNTGSGCAWSVYTDAQNWIRILTSASGSGTASISYNVLANTGAARMGHIYASNTPAVVTITQQAAAAPVPQLTVVENAASYASGPIAPGEVVALGGTGLGPATGVGAQLAANGQSLTTNLGGVQVLFDGKYPAALTYVSAAQVNAITPYEIAGEASTQITVQYQGGTSAAFEAQVAAAAPGIFTLDYNGIGQGAILNQNYSVNGNSYPAARGSTVMIYCSGAGPTDPPSTDAAITAGISTLVNQPVTVTIGGVASQVSYAGGAPDAVAGLTQINAVVPANAPTGAGVPVVIQIGTWQSQAGVTMVVQ